MKLILLISVALASPGLLGSDDFFKSFDDIEQGFDSNFGSDFGGSFGASPFMKGGLLDRGAALRSARKDDQPSQKGWNFDPITGKPLHHGSDSVSKSESNADADASRPDLGGSMLGSK